MIHVKELVSARYQGVAGQQYHRAVHRADDYTRCVLARSRWRKFRRFVTPDDDVLEYGAGTCVNLLEMVCRHRVAYDLSDAGASVAARNGIEFVTNLSELAGREFSVVVCHHTLEHVPDPLATLDEIKSLLRPGGLLVLCVPFETARTYRRYFPGEPNHHLFSWNPLTLGNLVSEAGLDVRESHVSPFGYEQRLAPLCRAGDWAYCLGLWVVRHLKPANEILLTARKPDIPADGTARPDRREGATRW
jgi:SAM-dependent methyltransferase